MLASSMRVKAAALAGHQGRLDTSNRCPARTGVQAAGWFGHYRPFLVVLQCTGRVVRT